jgi:NAD(P)-dependent dehydrogenase (short-subunit alcohol dehydrogenase family)
MDRRDILKGMTVAGAAAITGSAVAQSGGKPAAAAPAAPAKKGIGKVDVKPIDPETFIKDRFKGKTMIITGCARGMGRAAAIRAAKEGANVVGVDWIKDEGQAVIDGITKSGGKAVFLYGDVGDTSTCDRMVELAVEKFGGLDCALNNAGVMDAVFPGDPVDYEKQKHLIFQSIDSASDDYWDKVMRTNATGVFKSLRSEIRQMMKQMRGGSIVNVGSVTGIIGFGGTCAYSASKHAVSALTRSAAIDYSTYGIRVNSVNMGTTETPMFERAKALLVARARETGNAPKTAMMKINSLLQATDSNMRGATAEEQVAVMLFLLSDEASNLTGALYATDGGYTAY